MSLKQHLDLVVHVRYVLLNNRHPFAVVNDLDGQPRSPSHQGGDDDGYEGGLECALKVVHSTETYA